METYRLDRGWKFHPGDIEAKVTTHTEAYMAAKAGGAPGGASPNFDISDCLDVNLPHDWAVYNDFDERFGPALGYKARGKGWYFKKFLLDEADRDKELYIIFGGVSSHCVVYLNGSEVYRNFGGYNSFVVNITDMALYGSAVNSLAVFADASVGEGWWYEGAGIYRHVDLCKFNKTHIKPWGVFALPEKKSADVWEVTAKTTLIGNGRIRLKSYILDENDNVVGKEESEHDICRETEITQKMLTYSPYLWDVDEVHLYRLVSELYIGDELFDSRTVRFGFRTIDIDPEKGFFLNGRPLKLYGTCNHQDHAGVGVAVPDSVNEYRIKLLKEMGSNAYRCSHGNVDEQILDLCDEYGLLVMDEIRSFSTSPNGLLQARDMVLRDRNHPSIVMYSVLNEEPLQGSFTGQKLAKRLADEIRALDNSRFITAAMDGGYLEEDGAVFAVDIAGLNYNTANYDKFHEQFPKKPMISSETDSAFQTRGVYKTDFDKHIIDCYDSEAAPWGNTYRDGFKQVDTRDYVMGMFVWTGFDYRGEPTPFDYPSISTQFGIMDTCGFKKDAFYLNKAFFSKEPVIHLLPHWNHNEGDKVKVMLYTNCTEAELFLNGKSLGKKNVDKYDMCQWEVEFEPGELKAVGIKDGAQYTDIQKTALAPAKLVLEPVKTYFAEGTDDAAAVNVSLSDENGVFVPDCNELVRFCTEGCEIIGVGNGDPNSHEADKADYRRLFNGRCQAIVKRTEGEKALLHAECMGLHATVEFELIKDCSIKYIPSVYEKHITTWRKYIYVTDSMPDPASVIADCDMNTWELTSAAGLDAMFNGAVGYGQYRTSASVTRGDKAVVFKKITGDEVFIYINGTLAFSGECSSGRKVSIPLDDVSGDVQISVIFHTVVPDHPAGLDGPAFIQ
ncbi:MAG: glycoside hydrolase family 2 TIM barrel-domain containing protein [Clostridiales bacterium]|nr:glycoside hydrolase family 2 TIM barrel-domain containing protein [Clostridiales bacterium]